MKAKEAPRELCSPRQGFAATLIISAVGFLVSFGFSLLTPVLPLYALTFGVDLAMVGGSRGQHRHHQGGAGHPCGHHLRQYRHQALHGPWPHHRHRIGHRVSVRREPMDAPGRPGDARRRLGRLLHLIIPGRQPPMSCQQAGQAYGDVRQHAVPRFHQWPPDRRPLRPDPWTWGAVPDIRRLHHDLPGARPFRHRGSAGGRFRRPHRRPPAQPLPA